MLLVGDGGRKIRVTGYGKLSWLEGIEVRLEGGGSM
jgi:hypothetical protein